jgi:hypothetical protein
MVTVQPRPAVQELRIIDAIVVPFRQDVDAAAAVLALADLDDAVDDRDVAVSRLEQNHVACSDGVAAAFTAV